MKDIVTKNIRKPGQPGTKKLLKIYGDDLLCVRYKYDFKKKKKYKTIEIIIERADLESVKESEHAAGIIYVKTKSHEKYLRRKIIEYGGTWTPSKKAWKITRTAAKQLDLETRIVAEKAHLSPFYNINRCALLNNNILSNEIKNNYYIYQFKTKSSNFFTRT